MGDPILLMLLAVGGRGIHLVNWRAAWWKAVDFRRVGTARSRLWLSRNQVLAPWLRAFASRCGEMPCVGERAVPYGFFYLFCSMAN